MSVRQNIYASVFHTFWYFFRAFHGTSPLFYCMDNRSSVWITEDFLLCFMKESEYKVGMIERRENYYKTFLAKLHLWSYLLWLLTFWPSGIAILPLPSSMLLMWEQCRKESRTLRNQLSLSIKKKPFTIGTKPHTQRWMWSRKLLSPIRSSSTWFWNGNAQERGLWIHVPLIHNYEMRHFITILSKNLIYVRMDTILSCLLSVDGWTGLSWIWMVRV